MFPSEMFLSRDDDSLSRSSSTSSLSPPPVVFSNGISIPAKSSLSPPSTTSSFFSLSPSITPCTPSSPNLSCAYPSWPNQRSLSRCGGSNWREGSSYISDEDLADFACLDISSDEDMVVPSFAYDQQCISWSETRQPPVVAVARPSVMDSIRRDPRRVAPTERKKRRSSPLKRKAPPRLMSTITEGPE
ncbi:hypothetical protein MMC06_004530 [Schaereria dolodes]|nr:hypothetical protein [Schaereria dolodes]